MKYVRWLGWGLLVATVVFSMTTDVQAQRSRSGRSHAGRIDWSSYPPPRRMIDSPTAGMLRKGSFDTEIRAFSDGGVLGILQIGLTSRWQIGISYGGAQVISSVDPSWNPRMQFLTKFLILSETVASPGIAVGYEEQGFGLWIDSLSRYQIKSKGFYAVASKGYRGANFNSSIHGGVNLSRENNFDNDIDFFFGADIRFDNSLGLVTEFDMGLNDDRAPKSLGRGRGYLNAGVQWMLLDRVIIEGVFKDLLKNRRDTQTFGRELRLLYVEDF